MKTIVRILFAVTTTAVVLSCSHSGGETPDPVLEPAVIQNASSPLGIDLDTETYLDLVWTAASWNGDGIVTYTVLMDRESGDFSDPVLVLNPALETQSVSVMQSSLLKLFTACAENDEAETAVAKWAVTSSAGGIRMISDPQTINLAKSNKPAESEPVEFELGASVFAAGPAALEAGQEMSFISGHPFSTTADGYQDAQGGEVTPEYEFFTTIEAGKDFYLTYGESASKVDGYLTFSDAVLNAVSVLETSTEQPSAGLKVEASGIYRIRINATEKKALVQIVNGVSLRAFGREKNAKGKWVQTFTTDLPMEYAGNGVWKATAVEIKWGNDGFDTRFDTYKFAVSMNDGAVQLYGAMDNKVVADGTNPVKGTPAKYWALQPVQGGAVVDKAALRYPIWLLAAEKNPAFTADITLYLNFDKGDYYFHEFTDEKAL